MIYILIYRIGEAQLAKISPLFLLDSKLVGGIGLSTEQVGFIYGTVGVIFLVLGGIIGGIVASNKGLKYWIWWMVAAINIPDMVYVFLSYTQTSNIYLINICIAFEQFGYGFGFTAFLLFLIFVSEGEHKTSHYAIATGIMALGMMLPGMISGWMQEMLGYKYFFIWVCLSTIPAFLLTKFIPLDPEFGKKKKLPDMIIIRKLFLLFFLSPLIIVSGQQNVQNKKGIKNYNFANVDEIINKAIIDSAFPGAVVLIEQNGKIIYEKAFGHFTYDKNSPVDKLTTLFDLASLTKVIATTSCAMICIDRGLFNLDDKVSKYIPAFAQNGKENITIRNLLLHNSGLPAFKPYYKMFNNAKDVLNDIFACKLEYPTGTQTVYSDLGIITLGKIIERVYRKKT